MNDFELTMPDLYHKCLGVGSFVTVHILVVAGHHHCESLVLVVLW